FLAAPGERRLGTDGAPGSPLADWRRSVRELEQQRDALERRHAEGEAAVKTASAALREIEQRQGEARERARSVESRLQQIQQGERSQRQEVQSLEREAAEFERRQQQAAAQRESTLGR